MIWFVLRRYRTTLLVLLVVILGLDTWMLATAHSSARALSGLGSCASYRCQPQVPAFSTAHQAAIVNLLLLALPCIMGIAFGTTLVAGEFERSTHRLAWTQNVSRTRWYLVSLAVTVTSSLILVAVELPVAHWWAGVAWVDLPEVITLGGSRIQPNVFAVSGVVPIAYTVFALALGAVAGALVRRTSGAAVVTVVGYGLLAILMAFVVRSTFAPTNFLNDGTTDSAQYAPFPTPPPWNVTYEYRNIPGTRVATGAPLPDDVAAACSNYILHPQSIHPQWIVACMRKQDVEGGFVTQPPSHYWRLQWAEATLYVSLAVMLSGVGLQIVRRSQD